MKTFYRPRIIWFLFSFLYMHLNGQQVPENKKTLQAVRTAVAPRIDGRSVDTVWLKAPVATGLYEFEPGDGNPEPPAYQTRVRMLYDNTHLYILAEMSDPDPATISTEFGLRDQLTQADYFALLLNPFKAPGNNYVFSVTASGAQVDGIMAKNHMDLSWNAVWKSAVTIGSKGWTVEMAIPYSALRFQNKNRQEWAVNFIRYVNRTRRKFSWTHINKSQETDPVYFMGRLTGLYEIRPPVRLSFYPYASYIREYYQGRSEGHLAYGMDLKYGINANYTLDATLIPDFSDVPYDDVRLNLGPFEQYYGEKRQFFTEGVQLFSKGGLFYSRRIGSTPVDYAKVFYEKRPSEIILENPEKTRLINAVKISGRNDNGLGLGIMNAFVNRAEAVLQDTSSGEIRRLETQPYTNYNIMVADYVFGTNNSVSLINTNVSRFGPAPDANVTGLVYDLYARHNKYNVSGKAVVSMLNGANAKTGFHITNKITRTFRRHQLEAVLYLSDDKYDINDMGYMRKNNFVIYDFAYIYRILKPNKYFNVLRWGIDIGLDHIYKPYGIFRKDAGLEAFMTDKKYTSYGGRIALVSDTKDFYEPRVPGRYYLDPAHYKVRLYVSTDYRKKFALDVSGHFKKYFTSDQETFGFGMSPRFRFNSRFKTIYRFHFERKINERGFVKTAGGDIIFGKRDINVFTQSIRAQYFFDVRSAVSLNIRHYWSPVAYNDFYRLRNDGRLDPYDGNFDADFTFNVWNLDLGYSWEFAPGSRLNLLYRNSLLNHTGGYDLAYTGNLQRLFDMPHRNTFIVKATYYVDYNNLRRRYF
ncbi:MAG: carbohydrate binding family 9 domain-containing protein [Chlorobi bacterium]|nr:carbohydrate binding family 9 domain-containing protein [Chlorobiota bacterium]